MKGWGFSHVSRSNCWQWQRSPGSDPGCMCKVPSGHRSGVVTVLCKGTFPTDTIKPFSVTACVPGKLKCQFWSPSAPRSPQLPEESADLSTQLLKNISGSPLPTGLPAALQSPSAPTTAPQVSHHQSCSNPGQPKPLPSPGLWTGLLGYESFHQPEPLPHPTTLQAEPCCLLPREVWLSCIPIPSATEAENCAGKSPTAQALSCHFHFLLHQPLHSSPLQVSLLIKLREAALTTTTSTAAPGEGGWGARGRLQAVLSSAAPPSCKPQVTEFILDLNKPI